METRKIIYEGKEVLILSEDSQTLNNIEKKLTSQTLTPITYDELKNKEFIRRLEDLIKEHKTGDIITFSINTEGKDWFQTHNYLK